MFNWYLIALLVLAVTTLLGYVLVSPWARSRFEIWRQRRKHERAHRGLIICEDPDCDDVAVAYTPNGYFCDWHWEPMSKKKYPNGTFAVWHHDLYHNIRRS